MEWVFENKTIETIQDMPKGSYGFVYEITHIPTGKKYIGKKVLFFERNVRLGKRELQVLREERKAKKIPGRVPGKKKVITESDWKTYCGSHEQIKELLKEGGLDIFRREILMFVPSKKLLTYYENKYLYSRGVLEPGSGYLNDNIGGTIYSKDFITT